MRTTHRLAMNMLWLVAMVGASSSKGIRTGCWLAFEEAHLLHPAAAVTALLLRLDHSIVYLKRPLSIYASIWGSRVAKGHFETRHR